MTSNPNRQFVGQAQIVRRKTGGGSVGFWGENSRP